MDLHKRQVLVAIIAGLMYLNYGLTKGWSSPSLHLLRINNSHLGINSITKEQESWLASIPFLGALVSSPMYSFISHNFGPKTAGYVTVLPVIVGFLIIIFGNTIDFYYIARFIMGFCLSGSHVFFNLYVGEISEDKLRAFLRNFRGLAVSFGFLIIYTAGSYMSIQNTAILSIWISIVFLFILFWLPESPMFLVGKEKNEEATKCCFWFCGNKTDFSQQEITKLSVIISSKAKDDRSPCKLLSSRGTRKALTIAIIMIFVQELSGFDVVISYAANIFQSSESVTKVDMATIMFSVAVTFGSLFSGISSDISRRRPVIICTQFIQGMFLVFLGLYFYLKNQGIDVSSVPNIPLICIAIYGFCTVTGQINIFSVVMGEMFRPEVFFSAASVVNIMELALGFVTTRYFYMLVDVIGFHGCYWLFACVSFVGAVFILSNLPETKNTTLQLILRNLVGEQKVVNS